MLVPDVLVEVCEVDEVPLMVVVWLEVMEVVDDVVSVPVVLAVRDEELMEVV